MSSSATREEPHPKRARPNDSDHGRLDRDLEHVVPQYTRGAIWLDDGNIVLVAGGVAFRVHQSILSQNSEVFRDIFTLPQPIDAEKYEGRPVVHLTDSASDLVHILTITFQLREVLSLDYVPTFSRVSAMLRLGTKYQMEHLRQSAIQRLRRYFPEDLTSFDEVQEERNDDLDFSETYIEHMRNIDVIEVINLGRSHDIPDILPTAFYWAAQLDVDTLVHGYINAAGTSVCLSSSDLATCLKGKEHLRLESGKSEKFYITSSPSSQCENPYACEGAMRSRGRTRFDDMLNDCTALYGPSLINDMGICDSCESYYIERHEENRRLVWDELGDYFLLND